MADKVNGIEEFTSILPSLTTLSSGKSTLEDPQALKSAGRHSCVSL